jgi:GDP-L-fucose synthase
MVGAVTWWLASKRVLFTGGSDLLGRHVIAKLRDIGCNKIIAPTATKYNITQAEDVVRLNKDIRPQVVIHLAARVGGIANNLLRPAEMVYENLMMGLLLIEQARHYGVERFVATSSACAYSKEASTPTREEELWRGYREESNGPYGVAKRVLILLGQVYRQQYGLNAISLIATNLYGPGDNFDPFSAHVIPALIRKCIEAREPGSKRKEDYRVESTAESLRYHYAPSGVR